VLITGPGPVVATDGGAVGTPVGVGAAPDDAVGIGVIGVVGAPEHAPRPSSAIALRWRRPRLVRRIIQAYPTELRKN
jgi:hypothetical protein